MDTKHKRDETLRSALARARLGSTHKALVSREHHIIQFEPYFSFAIGVVVWGLWMLVVSLTHVNYSETPSPEESAVIASSLMSNTLIAFIGGGIAGLVHRFTRRWRKSGTELEAIRREMAGCSARKDGACRTKDEIALLSSPFAISQWNIEAAIALIGPQREVIAILIKERGETTAKLEGAERLVRNTLDALRVAETRLSELWSADGLLHTDRMEQLERLDINEICTRAINDAHTALCYVYPVPGGSV